jgi:rRNA maturation RNase YbeY
MKIAIAQKNIRIAVAEIRRFAIWLAKNIPEFSADDWAEVSIVVTDDAGISEINERFLKHRGPTDVITFTLPPIPGETKKRGEVYVNIERANAEAKRRRIEAAHELAFYIAHGFDHLCGFDDRTPAMRARMHRREREWLKKFKGRENA